MEQNYRSVQPILDAANLVIHNNVQRNPKKLWSEKTGTDRLRILTCNSGYQEADIVAELCKARDNHKPVAVLYR